MITVIEQRTMDAIQSINRKMKDSQQIDWEQRRYEIAKEILPQAYNQSNPIAAADEAVAYADALIAELKKSNSKKMNHYDSKGTHQCTFKNEC